MISAKKNNFIVEYRPSSIRVARISSETAPTVVEEILEIDLAKEGDAAAKLREFAKAKPSAYMHASCSVYPEDRVIRQVLLEASRGKEMEFVMDFLKNSVGINPDEFSAYCLSAAGGGEVDPAESNKKDILICGAPKSSIAGVQSSLVEKAVYPRRLELGTIGTIGALKDILGGDANRSPVLFLEMNASSTNAVIVGSKGVEMARSIEFGASNIAEALKDEMSLKDEAAAEKILMSQDFDLGPIAPKLLRKLLRELQSSIGFFEVQTGSSVSELYCLREGKSLLWLESSICDLLNLTPLNIDLSSWLEKKEVSLATVELASRMDSTWMSLFTLAIELGKGKADS